MKNLLKLFAFCCFIGLVLACTSKKDEVIAEPVFVVPEKTTVIYVVRHAEKASNSAQDPDLSAAGQVRALALKDSMSRVMLSAIYTTNFKRTHQTVAPTAQVKNLTPIVYDPADLTILASKIKQTYQNRTVLIAGHSNTVLETVEAFKAKRPVPAVNDHEYNYLFKITLRENKEPEVEVKRYGN